MCHTPIGYWAKRDYKYSGSIYQCSRKTCTQPHQNSSCWSISVLNRSIGDDDNFASEDDDSCSQVELQCSHGSHGPLCGACIDGFIYSGALERCIECQSASVISYVVVAALFIVLTFIVLLFRVSKEIDSRILTIKFLRYFDTGSLKVRVGGGGMNVR
jgi:hypothetical protein